MSHENISIAVSTTAPVDAETTVLFISTTAFGNAKMLRHLGIKRISFAVEHSHAGTLTAYRSSNSGTSWDVYNVQTVGVPAANNISGPYDYLVDTFDDWKLEWTNGGTTQTTWRPEMHGHMDRQPGT